MKNFQREITLPAFPRGFHLITQMIAREIPEIGDVDVGLLHVFIKHTSASLTLNENADPTVRDDFEAYFNRAVPEHEPYFLHTAEGPDDMPAHIKAVLVGSGLTVPITDGRMALGTWQGIYLYEHRTAPHRRRVAAHLIGE